MLRAVLAALVLLALPASAMHQAGDCQYQGPPPALPGSTGQGYLQLCAVHLDETDPAGSQRTQLDVVQANLWEQWEAAGRRVWASGYLEANQYAFQNAFYGGEGTRVYAGAATWAFQGFNILGGGGVFGGVREYEFAEGGGLTLQFDGTFFIPRVGWVGGAFYYNQGYGNGRCTESLVFYGTANNQWYYEELLPPQECVAQKPDLPQAVQP